MKLIEITNSRKEELIKMMNYLEIQNPKRYQVMYGSYYEGMLLRRGLRENGICIGQIEINCVDNKYFYCDMEEDD